MAFRRPTAPLSAWPSMRTMRQLPTLKDGEVLNTPLLVYINSSVIATVANLSWPLQHREHRCCASFDCKIVRLIALSWRALIPQEEHFRPSKPHDPPEKFLGFLSATQFHSGKWIRLHRSESSAPLQSNQ
eukprot:4630474-Amphidinium_carterae.1